MSRAELVLQLAKAEAVLCVVLSVVQFVELVLSLALIVWLEMQR